MKKSPRRDRFERVASKRVQKLLNNFDLLINCSNRRNYEYTQEDVNKMSRAVKEKLKELESAFSLGSNYNKKTEFKF